MVLRLLSARVTPQEERILRIRDPCIRKDRRLIDYIRLKDCILERLHWQRLHW